MREIKIKYGYSDGTNTFEKAFTLGEIEQGLQFDEISDSPLLKNYKIIYKRQYTGLEDINNQEIYNGDFMLDGHTGRYGEVKFIKGAFVVDFDNEFQDLDDWTHECIIGNIYKTKIYQKKI